MAPIPELTPGLLLFETDLVFEAPDAKTLFEDPEFLAAGGGGGAESLAFPAGGELPCLATEFDEGAVDPDDILLLFPPVREVPPVDPRLKLLVPRPADPPVDAPPDPPDLGALEFVVVLDVLDDLGGGDDDFPPVDNPLLKLLDPAFEFPPLFGGGEPPPPLVVLADEPVVCCGNAEACCNKNVYCSIASKHMNAVCLFIIIL